MYQQVVINDDNMKALAQFIGKQAKINLEIFSYLKQLPIEGIPEVAQYHIEELNRLLKEMENIRWQTI